MQVYAPVFQTVYKEGPQTPLHRSLHRKEQTVFTRRILSFVHLAARSTMPARRAKKEPEPPSCTVETWRPALQDEENVFPQTTGQSRIQSPPSPNPCPPSLSRTLVQAGPSVPKWWRRETLPGLEGAARGRPRSAALKGDSNPRQKTSPRPSLQEIQVQTSARPGNRLQAFPFLKVASASGLSFDGSSIRVT